LFSATIDCNMDMQGKTCVVTGASNGIGKETARELARRGAHVVMLCRNRAKGEAALDDIRASVPDAKLELVIGDLSSQASVKQAAAEILARRPKIDVLVNNAGISIDYNEKSADGVEMVLATNHLGPFLLTHLLGDALAAAAPARVVTVASALEKGARLSWDDLEYERTPYSMMKVYSQSKLLNVMFSHELARRWKDRGITVNCLHPGVIDTGLVSGVRSPLMRGLFKVMQLFFKSADKGAEGSVYLACSPEVEGKTGGYYVDKKLVKSNPITYDQEALARLWSLSEKYLGLAAA
jgi:NAD(P)-dependent dehydrogenase (short-subunit alcohol dehydrogenase family)